MIARLVRTFSITAMVETYQTSEVNSRLFPLGYELNQPHMMFMMWRS